MSVKPPLGLEPKIIHDSIRFDDVADAIRRYVDSICIIPIEWVNEYNDIIKSKTGETMSAQLDLDDVASQSELEMKELEVLRNRVKELEESIELTNMVYTINAKLADEKVDMLKEVIEILIDTMRGKNENKWYSEEAMEYAMEAMKGRN